LSGSNGRTPSVGIVIRDCHWSPTSSSRPVGAMAHTCLPSGESTIGTMPGLGISRHVLA
jgi:hypothetical protein